MCLGEVARVESVIDDSPSVLTTSGYRSLSLAVLRGEGIRVAPGDWVLASMGFALHLLPEHDVRTMVRDAAELQGAEQPDAVFGEVFQ